MTLKFDELGAAAREKFIDHAALLIEKNYVTNISLDKLAEQVYDSYIKSRIENQSHSLDNTKNSFLDYDKDDMGVEIRDKKENNWLK